MADDFDALDSLPATVETRAAFHAALAAGRLAEAERIARAAVHDHPESEGAWLLMAAYYRSTGQVERARRVEEQRGIVSTAVPIRRPERRRNPGSNRLAWIAGAMAVSGMAAFALWPAGAPLRPISVSRGGATVAATGIYPASRQPISELLDRAYEDYRSGKYSEADSLLSRAELTTRSPAQSEEHANVLGRLAEIYEEKGYLKDSERALTDALDIRNRLKQPLPVAHLRHLRGEVRTRLGDYGAAREDLEASRLLRVAGGDETGIALCDRDLGNLKIAMNEPRRAESYFSAAMNRAKNLGKPDIVADLDGCLGRAARDSGDLDRSLRLSERALTYWRGQAHSRWIGSSETQLASVYTRLGRLTESASLLTDASRRFADVGDRLGAAEADLATARVLRAQNVFDTAMDRSAKALESAQSTGAGPLAKRAAMEYRRAADHIVGS